MSRCTGHCCRGFCLSIAPDKLRQSENPEHQFVADMVIPLGDFTPGESLPDGEPATRAGTYYTCRHYDVKSGDCLVYEHRPQMCRALGVTVKCNKRGCTLNCNRGESCATNTT